MFLPIALLAYILNAGSTIIDKVLLKTGLPNPIVYAFFINILGILGLLLIPFGVVLEPYTIILSIVSGVSTFLAIFCFFRALKNGEASVVVPVVGSLNPTFSLIIGSIFLHHLISTTHLLAFFIIISGTAVLTCNLWVTRLKFNTQLRDMILAGLFFAIGYLTLKETFDSSNFITGLALSRAAGGIFALLFLLIPIYRQEILSTQTSHPTHHTGAFFVTGQALGAFSGLLLTLATFFANPALVNSLFGAQYLTILIVAVFLKAHHRGKLLDEDLSGPIIVQKIIGAVILSVGVYLLSI